MSMKTKEIDKFYGLGILDLSIFKAQFDLISSNSGAWAVWRLRSGGLLFLGASPVAGMLDVKVFLPMVVVGVWALICAHLYYPELVALHLIRVAAGRNEFTNANGKAIAETFAHFKRPSKASTIAKTGLIALSFCGVMVLFVFAVAGTH